MKLINFLTLFPEQKLNAVEKFIQENLDAIYSYLLSKLASYLLPTIQQGLLFLSIFGIITGFAIFCYTKEKKIFVISLITYFIALALSLL